MSTAVRSDPPRRISRSDVLAGASVALILIPQSMAYAELAGLPAHHGLYAASLPLIAAAFLASSPYLQTGPVALTALLTLGALTPLAPIGTAEYAALAAVLAFVVGVARMLVGMLKAGWLVYLMSRSMMTGFLSGAAILILSSQLPGALGSVAPAGGVLQRAWWALTTPESWDVAAIGLTLVTIILVDGTRRLHPLVPGVLFAAVVGLVFSIVTGYEGVTVGSVPRGLPPFSIALPWDRLPQLVVPGIVISIIGFAEGVSISRLFASQDRQRWDADREFMSKGLACMVAGVTAGLPVGGSLSRTSVNRLAGARSRWSGLVTGVVVLLFLPFAGILGALPRAVLSGIVIAAISSLVRPRELLQLWQLAHAQAVVGWTTFGLTLLLAPRIDRAILLGVALAAFVHLWRELTPRVTAEREGDTLVLAPSGVLADEPDVTRVVIRCEGLGRIDLTGAYTLAEMIHHADLAGIEMELIDIPNHAARVLTSVGVYGPAPVERMAPDQGPEGT
jgi:SulP family sulfate permease